MKSYLIDLEFNPETPLPVSAASRKLVLEELDRMLSHPTFRKSARCTLLFRYLVELALETPDAHPKERALGHEVFGREPAYDTAADPIVRTTINEIRKRISVYLQEGGDQSAVRIEIRQGSYLPRFTILDRAAVDSEVRHPEVRDHAVLDTGTAGPPETSQEAYSPAPLVTPAILEAANKGSNPQPRRTGIAWKIAAACAALAVLLAIAFALRPAKLTNSDRFWKPFVGSTTRALICFPSLQSRQMAVDAQQVSPSLAGVPSLPWPDIIALLVLRSRLDASHTPAPLREADKFELTDVKSGPVIFLGGVDNRWAMNYLSRLRFHITLDAKTGRAAIVDGQNAAAALTFDESTPYRAPQTDYAIISRFQDPATGNPIMQLSGLGVHGTASAAEFVMNPKYMNALDPKLFTCGANLQLVIETQVIDASAGPPSVIASHCW